MEMTMNYRKFGKMNWQVSAIGFGAWGIGGQWGDVPEDQAISAIHAALDEGVNFFDTADAYGEPQGRSEFHCAKALKSVRKEVYIATKVGNWCARPGHSLSYAHINHVIGCCHASLYRLGTDYIDFYQCHIGNLIEPDIFLEAFDTLVDQGLVRTYGISTNNVNVVKALNRDGKCAGVQLDYSLLNRTAEAKILTYCEEHSIATVIRGPLAKGLLSGKFTSESKFTDKVRTGWNDGGQRDVFLKRLEIVEKLKPLSNDDRSLAQVALQFVLSHPAVTTAIPGAKDDIQARANAAAGSGKLTDDELKLARSLTDS